MDYAISKVPPFFFKVDITKEDGYYISLQGAKVLVDSGFVMEIWNKDITSSFCDEGIAVG